MRNWNPIRQRAAKLLEIADVRTLPIPVRDIAAHLGLKIVETDLDSDVSGLLVRKDGASWIFVRVSDSEPRKRFTIAHELGHFHLGHQFGSDAVHVDRGYRIHARGPQAKTGEVRQEVEANQYAAALLMPEAWLRREVDALGRGGYADEDDVKTLAEKFGVSVQAMTIRLSVLELL